MMNTPVIEPDKTKYSSYSQLAKAIEDFEFFILQGKDGQVYRFLLDAVEKSLIEKILQKTDGNQLRTAQILGINRNTLHAKIRKLKIDISSFKGSKGYRNRVLKK